MPSKQNNKSINQIVYSPPADVGSEVLYCDADILVVNKPSGLLSVPGRGENKKDCLVTRLQVDYPDALIVHRLDMETSGVMVLARDKTVHRRLSLMFQNREVKKRYIAVVEGLVKEKAGEIDLPLICDWPNRPRQKVDHVQGKPSCTAFNVLGSGVDQYTTRVALVPETGRSHQLRVHMLSLGHPILGDRLYGGLDVQAKSSRLLLHAEFLAFEHPRTGEWMEMTSKSPF